MDFRKDINGLRAIAVIAVMLFHFNPAWLPGGYAGVDIFFVISGYLITGIIFRGLQKNTFSLIAFYTSRARRIIPALAAMCFVLLLFGWFYLLPLQYGELGKHIASSLGFFSNVVYRAEAGYFTAGAHEKWLLHTWSLSVEWQFYMIYPIALLALSKRVALPILRRLVLVSCVFGFIFCVYSSFHSPERAFYLLPARAWELLVGGVAYLYPIKLQGLKQRALESVGLLMIALSFIVLSEKDVWPGYLSLLPVIGTLLVIVSVRQDSALTNNPFSQWTGKLSYSLYLWHWPVVVFMSNAGYLSSDRNAVFGIAVSLALAWMSYSLIEKSSVQNSPYHWKFATVSALIALVFTGGVAVNASEGAVSSLRSISNSDKARFVNDYAAMLGHIYETYWIKCDAVTAFNQSGKATIDPACIRKQGEGGVFLWGDSHAQAMSIGLRTLLPKGTPFYQVASVSCRPNLVDDHDFNKSPSRMACNYSNKTALEGIQALRPDVVILVQKEEHDKTNWNEIAAQLKSYGVKHVVLVGPLPQWSPSLPSVIANRHWNTTDSHISDSALDQSVMTTERAIQSSIDQKTIDFVSLIDKLCIADSCLVRLPDGHSLLQFDASHLTEKGSIFIVKNYVIPELEKLK
jgi:peptidoglycan/LPS O-acetylase OafA/YrhL